MVELRKRKAPEAAAPPPATKKSGTVKGAVAKAKEAVIGKSTANGTASKPSVGNTVTLDGFGGEVETNDGVKTTLKKLVDESTEGVVLFTYPKASTPGCTNQACLFRDGYSQLTSTGLSIYGLSTDSPKANTTFKTKQNLQYPLLSDPQATLIAAIGMKKSPSGTTRGVFVVDKTGKVLAAEAGGPAATVEAVKKVLASKISVIAETAQGELAKKDVENGNAEGEMKTAPAGTDSGKEDSKIANVAAEVSDTAAKLDGEGENKDETKVTEAAAENQDTQGVIAT